MSDSEHNPLLSNSNSSTDSISYESFPHRRDFEYAATTPSSISEILESDASHVIPKILSTTSAAKIRIALIDGLKACGMRAWEATRWIKFPTPFGKNTISAPRREIIALLLMGVAAALMAYIVDVAESRIFDWKYGFCTTKWTSSKPMCCLGYNDCSQWQTWSEIAGYDAKETSSYLFNFAIYSTLVLLLSMLSHVVTRFSKATRPHSSSTIPVEQGEEMNTHQHYFAAAGSGVLDVKRKLWGIQEEASWKASTLLFKTLGLIMSTSSGLSVGKEGPYVHLSATIANLINNGLSPSLRISTQKSLSIGSATGMAVAFGAPVTGALFVMEDFGQLLNAFNLAVLLGGGIVGGITLSTLGPYGDDKIVPWEVRYSTTWSWAEMPLFVVIGTAAGVVSACFIGSVRVWSTFYRRIGRVKRHPAMDVFLVALLTASTSFWAKHLRYGTAELLSDLTSPSEKLPSHSSSQAVISLGAALCVKFVLTVVTFGLQIPQGIYMPSLAIGALLGRFVGEAALLLPENSPFGSDFHPNPAVYAMAGAGAVAAGITRLQLCIVALVFETTRSWEYAVLFAVSIVTAKAVAAYLEPQGIYDLVATLHGQRLVEEVLKSSDAHVDDVWDPQISRTPSMNLVSGFMTHVYSLEMLLEVAEISGSRQLPILRHKRLVGCVSIEHFRQVLQDLDDSLAVILTQNSANTLTLHVAPEDEPPSSGFTVMEDVPRGMNIELPVSHPAVFESCSTLGALAASFQQPNVEYVCVAKQGTSWTVVTREMLAEWTSKLEARHAFQMLLG